MKGKERRQTPLRCRLKTNDERNVKKQNNSRQKQNNFVDDIDCEIQGPGGDTSFIDGPLLKMNVILRQPYRRRSRCSTCLIWLWRIDVWSSLAEMRASSRETRGGRWLRGVRGYSRLSQTNGIGIDGTSLIVVSTCIPRLCVSRKSESCHVQSRETEFTIWAE